MSRQPRTIVEYMHVIVRGNGKQILFEDSSDREKYLFFLQKYAEETKISILAYCLMENHVHLLIRDTEGNTPIFMKKMGVSYALYYNREYGHTGHLFQDRYKSEIIKDDTCLLSVFRYILKNPEKAGICRAEDYFWSSYQEYGKEGCITDTRMLRGMIGEEAEYHSFMQQQDEREHMEAESHRRDDKWALAELQKTLQVKSGTMLQQYDREQRDNALALLKEKGLTVRQLERLTGINRGVIQKAKKCQREPSP